MTNEALVRYIRQGDSELMGKLYEQNKPVIRMIAQKLTDNASDYEDALQDAYFGLVAAVNAYDEDRGFKFITCASYHIRTAIKRGKTAVQPIPEWLQLRAAKIKQAQNELAQQLQRTPTGAELSLRTGLSVEQIKYTLRAIKPPKAIDTPLDEDFTIADTIADNSVDFENDIAEADEQQRLHTVVDELPERERQVIQFHYFHGLTYKEIGQNLNISIERVRQVIRVALQHLRHPRMARKLIDEEIDRRTSFYRHRGIQSFNNTWTSSTEQVVLDRENYRRKEIEKLLQTSTL